MKLHFRLLGLTLILAMIVALLPVGTPAQAQDDCPNGLNRADCELLNNATDLLRNTSAFNITDYTFDFQFRTNGDTTQFKTEGSGPVLFNNGEIAGLDISFNPATLTTGGDTQTGGGVLRVNDDGLFLGIFDENGDLTWSGLAGDTSVQGADSDDLGDVLDDLGDQDFSDQLTITRTDETIDGRTVAVFEANIDVAGFVRSPFFTSLASQVLVGLLADQELDPTLAAILVQTLLDRVASDLAENNVIRSIFHVDVETLDISYFSLLIDLTLDLSFVRGLSPDIDAIIPAGGLGIGLDLQANIADYDGDFEVVTPEDYEDLGDDLDDLLGELLGGGLPFDFGFNPTSESSGTSVSASNAEFSIGPDDSATGTLSSDNATDTYVFDASAGDRVEIAVRASDPADFLDPIVELYDADGQLLGQNDDAANPPADLELGFFDSYLTYTIEADGAYVIVVSSVFPVDSAEYELFFALQ